MSIVLRHLIRKIILENINGDKISQLVTLLTKKFNEEYGVSCDLINQGDCEVFAEELQDMLKEVGVESEILSDGLFYDVFGDTEDDMLWDVSPYGIKPNNFDEVGLPSHYWIYANGKHYDSDAPQGVSDMFQLPIIVNFYNRANNKN